MTSETDATSDPAVAPDERAHADRPHPALALVLIGAVVIVSLLALAVRAIEPDGPGAFYTPPATTRSGEPGTIIRSEPLDTAPPGSRGWRVLYESTGRGGEPIATSGVVFAPSGPPPDGGRRVVAWAHPTTGVASRCAPSIEADGGSGTIAGFEGLLAAGFVVTATDYPGLGTPGPHPYLVGDSEARAVIDSVRAARQLDGTGAGASFAVWGHSQGGHAALFVGQIAPTYAPDLELVGVAAAAPATSLAELLRRDTGGVTGNVLASMAIVSWSEVFADRGATLDTIVEDRAVPVVELIADHCIETTAQALIELPAAEVLQVGFLEPDPWSIPPWNAILAENTPDATVDAPILIAQGTADTVVWPGVTADWVAARCQAGAVIDERLYEGRTHTEIAAVSAADATSWMQERFDGRRAPSTCPSRPS